MDLPGFPQLSVDTAASSWERWKKFAPSSISGAKARERCKLLKRKLYFPSNSPQPPSIPQLSGDPFLYRLPSGASTKPKQWLNRSVPLRLTKRQPAIPQSKLMVLGGRGTGPTQSVKSPMRMHLRKYYPKRMKEINEPLTLESSPASRVVSPPVPLTEVRASAEQSRRIHMRVNLPRLTQLD